MSKNTILIDEKGYKQCSPSDLSGILFAWKNNIELSDITNNETIELLKKEPISNIISKTTESFFYHNITYFNNLIDSEKKNTETINSEISFFLSQYKEILDIYPYELNECLKETFEFNDDEIKSFINACNNTQQQTINFNFFEILKHKESFNNSRQKFEQEFMSWLENWETNKLLNKTSESKFSKKYELFFKYVEDVLLKSEHTENLADLKNYVLSGYMFNDFFATNPKKINNQIWELRKSFIEYIGGKANNEEINSFKYLLLKRQRETLVYIHQKTVRTNDISTTQVEIENAQIFANKNEMNAKFANGDISIMPPMYLDRARIDIDYENTIWVDDAKSTNTFSENDTKSLHKNIVACLILSLNYKIKLSIFSPSICPNTNQFDLSNIKIGYGVNNSEINAIHELSVISALCDVKKYFDLEDENISNNFEISKSNIGSQSSSLKKISEFKIPDKIDLIVSFFEKNIDNINTTRWLPVFEFLLDTLENLHYSYEPKEINDYNAVFSHEMLERINSIFAQCPWYTSNKKRNISEKIFPCNPEIITNNNFSENLLVRDWTKINQEKNELTKLVDRYNKYKEQETSLNDLDFKYLQRMALIFARDMWDETYHGTLNQKKEQTIIKYLLAKNHDIGPADNKYLSNIIKGKYNGYACIFRGTAMKQSSWQDLDKLYYLPEQNRFEDTENLILDLAKKFQLNQIPSYGKAQRRYIQMQGKFEYKKLMTQVVSYAQKIEIGQQQKQEKLIELRNETIALLSEMNVHPKNMARKQELLDNLNAEKLKKPKP